MLSSIFGAWTPVAFGVLAITHYSRLLDELHADRVHILARGTIVRSGGPELARELDEKGYVGFLGAELAGEPEAVAVGRPTIDDPFGGPGGSDPFADPLGGL